MDKGLLEEAEIYSLVLYKIRLDQLKRTHFYNYYSQNKLKINLDFSSIQKILKESDNFLKDENDEYIRSFVAIFRLFSVKRDLFSLETLKNDYFSENGSLRNEFVHESNNFKKLYNLLRKYLDSIPSINLNLNQYSFETNEEILENFVYGGLIHSNKDKFDKFCAFNMHKNLGQRYITHKFFRFNTIIILFNVLTFLDEIHDQIIHKIIEKNSESHWKLINNYEKSEDYENAMKYLRNLTWIYSTLENYQEMFKLYNKRGEIQTKMNKLEDAKSSFDICKDIQEVIDGKIPDFSDYTQSITLKKK